jgi:predicted lipoprotein
MKSLRLYFLVISSLLLCACQQEQEPPANPELTLLLNLGQQVIVPWHQQFSDEALLLQRNSNEFCSNTSTRSLESLQQSWRSTMGAWQQIQLITFGPIQADNLSWKVQFWPDRHNLIKRKTDELLASDDDITAERISEASVVIQGLSSLEYLLFDPEAETALKQARRCQLLLATTEHTHSIAEKLSQQWQQHYLSTFTQPGPDNKIYSNKESALIAVVDSLLASLEVIKKDKLEKPLGYSNKSKKARPYLSEAWRSEYSLKSIEINIVGLQTIYQQGLDSYLGQQENGPALKQNVDNHFQQMMATLNAVNLPLSKAVKDPQQQTILALLHQQLTSMIKLFKYEVPATMGITLGFNANDGD